MCCSCILVVSNLFKKIFWPRDKVQGNALDDIEEDVRGASAQALGKLVRLGAVPASDLVSSLVRCLSDSESGHCIGRCFMRYVPLLLMVETCKNAFLKGRTRHLKT